MIKVTKFGGSSVASSEQFRKVKNIVLSDETRKFVVTSACGKANKEDYKVTDLLYLMEAHRKYGVSYDSLFQQVKEKYRGIKKELNLSVDIEKEFETIQNALENKESTDYLVSRGEYLTGLLLADYLGAKFVDARDVICFNYEGNINLEKTKEQLEYYAQDAEKIVIPGFYGALPNGVVKVMSRGGSDITGAVIANVVDADIYENWTDVSGFLVADPRIIHHPVRIPRITYGELREMSYMGANVLHDDAVFPVRMKGIPINIRNTNDPENAGTMIMANCDEMDAIEPPHVITGITGRKNFTCITVSKAHSSTMVGFLRKLLLAFEKYNISIESVPVTVDTFSVIVKSEAIEQCLYDIVSDIKKELHPDDIHVEEHIAQIAVVGREMTNRPGMSGALLSEFGNHSINIRTINQSSDELTIVVGVNDNDFEKAIHVIYDKFIAVEENEL